MYTPSSDFTAMEIYINQGIYAFEDIELVESPGIYIKEYVDSSYSYNYDNIGIYDCDKNKCIKTTEGYIKLSDNNLLKCNSNGCDTYTTNTDLQCDYSNVGKAVIDNNNNFNICVNDNGYDFKNIEKKVNYILNRNDNSKYNLYKSNEYGNIIAVSMTGKKRLLYNFIPYSYTYFKYKMF